MSYEKQTSELIMFRYSSILSQPNNLVSLSKFQIIVTIHFFRNSFVFTIDEHKSMDIAVLIIGLATNMRYMNIR